MEERTVLHYLQRQIYRMAEAESQTPGRLRACLRESGPRDQEILALLALTTMLPEFPLRHRFSTPLEAVARLPSEGRARLCQEFRACFFGNAPSAIAPPPQSNPMSF
ncbi:MAG: hypothetical protein ACRD06_07960 [Terriglobia bacterium]